MQRYGPVRAVRPEVVIEVSFDSLQKSARHKSGFALRFPRIVRLRPDKSPTDVTTLEEVRELYARVSGLTPSPPGGGEGWGEGVRSQLFPPVTAPLTLAPRARAGGEGITLRAGVFWGEETGETSPLISTVREADR